MNGKEVKKPKTVAELRIEKRAKMLESGQLRLSVSQIHSVDPKNDYGCYRSWWFKSILKLPQLKTFATNFGDVLHEVAERFLEADDFGRGEDGKPAELYPAGWEKSTNRWTGKQDNAALTEEEKVRCKALINSAIESGMLSRMPGREIEKELKFVIHEHENLGAFITGFIDLCEPNAIKDHKTANGRNKMKSKAALKKNIQLVSYAYIRWMNGDVPKTETQMLEHLYYICDKNTKKLSTERRFAEIDFGDAKRFMKERVFPLIEKMIEMVLCIEDYKDIAPTGNTFACGYCDFLPICSGKKTVEQYKEHIERITGKKREQEYNKLASKITSENNKTETGESTMALDLKAKLAGAKSKTGTAAATTPAPTPEVKKETVAPKTNTQPPTASGDTRPAAPWAKDQGVACPMCKTSDIKGLKPNGEPCGMCVAKAKGAGKVLPDQCEIFVDEAIVMICDLEGNELMVHDGGEPEVTHKEKGDTKADEAAAVAQAEADAQEAAELEKAQAEADAQALAAAEENAKGDEPPQEAAAPAGMTLEHDPCRGKGLLLIGCAFTSGATGSKAKVGSPAFCITGDELLIAVKTMLWDIPELKAERLKSGIDCWEGISSFKRRDIIAAYSAKIAEELGNGTIQCESVMASSDLDAIIKGISPFMRVIRAVVQ